MPPNPNGETKLTPPMQTIPGEALYDTLMSDSIPRYRFGVAQVDDQGGVEIREAIPAKIGCWRETLCSFSIARSGPGQARRKRSDKAVCSPRVRRLAACIFIDRPHLGRSAQTTVGSKLLWPK